jgi:hypothetical protein
MTANEMKQEFLVGYDKIANQSSPGYIDSEISQFLSEAQETIIKNRYSPYGNKYGDSFEETEKRRKELQGLISPSVEEDGTPKTTLSSNQSSKFSNSSFIYDLPIDLWLPIIEWVKFENCEEVRDVIPITHDEFILQRKNPFLKPNKRKCWRLDSNKFENNFRYEIISNGDIPLEYHIQYLKKPSNIVVGDSPVDCELHDLIHREIISKAIDIALEAAQDERFQSHAAINNNIE